MKEIFERRSFGVGFDLPWGPATGFVRDAAGADRLSPRLVRFLTDRREDFHHVFVSWQPKSRAVPRLSEYQDAFDRLFADLPDLGPRALHHTLLNAASMEPYDRGAVFDFTNALVDRYKFRWINEDLGFWSLKGRPLPYPLAPVLTSGGLRACIRNIREIQSALTAPFVVEFPGFSEGMAIRIGHMDPYEFFRLVVEETDSPCNLDVGHLLSARWMAGHRGEALYADLDRLPLAHAFEFHLSGCQIRGGQFFDSHHGILLDEQLILLERLLPLCPNARAVTYEDPRVTEQGALIPGALPGYEKMREVAA